MGGRKVQRQTKEKMNEKTEVGLKETLEENKEEKERLVERGKDIQVMTEITQTGSWCQRQRKPHLCT